MKRTGLIVMALCVIGLAGCATPPNTTALNFRGWYSWGGLEARSVENTVTLNGTVDIAGYVSEQLSRNINNRRIILEIKNIEASNFNGERFMKITVNKDDQTVYPVNNIQLIDGEYIPTEYTKVEFVLPNNFDGKLGFVFVQADLKNLQITVTYM